MKILRINELEQMARDFIDGKVEPEKIFSLQIFDLWAALTLCAVYSSTRIGLISQKMCMKMKFNIFNQYEWFRTRTAFFEANYDIWVNQTRDYSCARTELTKALSDKDCSINDINVIALGLIDSLTKENIYLKLYERRMNDKDFQKNAIKAGSENIDSYIAKFGNEIPYAKLLERFYAATVEDNVAELFCQLDPEKFRDYARKSIPVKKDDCKGIAVSLEKLFGRKK